MHFDAFVARCRLLWPEFDDRARLARSRNPTDRSLSHILGEIHGMATENKLALLNAAVSALDRDEVYVEVGCYKGASIVGAATGHPDARIFACDNFVQFDGAAEALRQTLDNYTALGQVNFYDLDFRAFFENAPWRPRRIGAYFYDGGHSFQDQYDGIAVALPHLADDAVIIIDDTNKRAARSANNLVARSVPGLELVLDLRTPGNHSSTWWNGIQVYRYRRATTDSAVQFHGPGYALRKFIYDDIFLEMRHRRRALRKSIKDRIRAFSH
jgi:protein O-GlcNAc transferase